MPRSSPPRPGVPVWRIPPAARLLHYGFGRWEHPDGDRRAARARSARHLARHHARRGRRRGGPGGRRRPHRASTAPRTARSPTATLEDTSVSVEAYSWGALTSGVQGFFGWVKRALWLILLPFALVNLAYWARLELGRGSGQAQWGARAVRVSGLLLTVFFVLTPCVVAIDMGAWQCFRYGVPGCSALPGLAELPRRDWTRASGSPWRRSSRWRSSPCCGGCRRRRSAATRAWSRPSHTPRAPADAEQPVLLHPHLWDGSERTLRLQRFHLAAAVAIVVAFTGIHLLRAGWGSLTFWSGGRPRAVRHGAPP